MIAAVDCGSNTIKLFIGDPPDAVVRESRTVRLGQGVDTSGELADEALARAFAALEEYALLVAAHPVERIRFCATSATRDAANAALFAAGVHARLGVWPEVLSGQEEAELTFAGAVRHLRTPPAEPVLVVDIGGGSTELVLGTSADGHRGITQAASLDAGSVRMYERHLHSDPASTAELAACAADVDALLDGCGVDLAAARTVVGVAGSVLTVTAGVLGLPAYDPSRIDQAEVPVTAVNRHVDGLLRMTHRQRLALPFMHPGRADVITAGALILDRVLRRTTATSLVASEADILDGIAWSIA